MKLFIKLIMLALILSYASLFVIKKPDGTPVRTLDSLIPSFDFSGSTTKVSDSVNSLLTVFNNISNGATVEESASNREVKVQAREIYRWQDEQGIWHYTDTPPPGVDAKIMEIQAPTVMNLYPYTDEEPEESGLVDVVTAENETSLIPERFREMQNTLQQAEDVSEQFRERMEQQQRILEDL
ncbi:MAG: DUF4124 domain-containing protein [Gammaproteobacteria bacterium]|nr:DUF4124 domain-containing protein [Gammaproteobacteria bacterium]